MKFRSSSSSSSSESSTQRTIRAATITLCICILVHGYLIISVFPYAGFMAMNLVTSLTEETAGPYAGFISSSFMMGRALSSVLWGRAADVYGRRAVLQLSLGLSCLLSILFGVSPSLGWAMMSRFLLGLSNGIVGTVKTLVSEISRGDEKVETSSMGLVMGMFGWGFLVSPAISSILAEPLRQYPESTWIEEFRPILGRFPFLLPNLAGALFCGLCMIAIDRYIKETLPEEKRREWTLILQDICCWAKGVVTDQLLCCTKQNSGKVSSGEALPLINKDRSSNSLHATPLSSECRSAVTDKSDSDSESRSDQDIVPCRIHTSGSCSMLSTQLDRKSSCSIDTSILQVKKHTQQQPTPVTMSSLWHQQSIRQCLIITWLYNFSSVCVDEGFPLFCMSKTSGLALTELSIGKILSASGFIFALSQYFIYSTIVNKYGLYNSLKISGIIGIPLILLITLSLRLNDQHQSEQQSRSLTWSAFIFLSICMAFLRVFGSICFSSLAVILNRTVQLSERATVNGLSMLGGSVSKAVAPMFVGYLIAFSFASGVFGGDVGALVVFGVLGMIRLMVTVLIFISLDEEE